MFGNAHCAGSMIFFEGRSTEVRDEDHGGPNKAAAAYRRHARACHMLVRHAQNEDQRQQLLVMAETWESLALERETMASAD